MSSTHMSLDAAAQERKARLAKLASLKRKRPESESGDGNAEPVPEKSTDKYLSGRNYDVAAQGPRLGFESQPSTNEETVEQEAARIAQIVRDQSTKDATEESQTINLQKLQPKKPNWDLKRELAERMKPVDVLTQNAIARLVRQRIEAAKKEAKSKGATKGDEGEELGVDGNTLVEAVHLREQEEAEAEDREDDGASPVGEDG